MLQVFQKEIRGENFLFQYTNYPKVFKYCLYGYGTEG